MPYFRFSPDMDEDFTPWKQVHYGHDFSGGNVCEVTDEFVVRKLRGNRYFEEVEPARRMRKSRSLPTPDVVADDMADILTGAQDGIDES